DRNVTGVQTCALPILPYKPHFFILQKDKRYPSMAEKSDVIAHIKQEFKDDILTVQETRDNIPTLWFSTGKIVQVMDFLKNKIERSEERRVGKESRSER